MACSPVIAVWERRYQKPGRDRRKLSCAREKRRRGRARRAPGERLRHLRGPDNRGQTTFFRVKEKRGLSPSGYPATRRCACSSAWRPTRSWAPTAKCAPHRGPPHPPHPQALGTAHGKRTAGPGRILAAAGGAAAVGGVGHLSGRPAGRSVSAPCAPAPQDPQRPRCGPGCRI